MILARNAAFLLLSGLFFLAFPDPRIAFAGQMDDYPVVKLRALDKVTARNITFEARVGSTLKFGNIYIKVQSCRKAPPIEQPESASFLQIWEVPPERPPQWIFSGWMFASSPALSAMDHPVYDVWVLDCLTAKQQTEEEIADSEVREGEGEIEEEYVPAQPETPYQDIDVETLEAE